MDAVIWQDRASGQYYLISENVSLPRGDVLIEDIRQRTRSVMAVALLPFEVSDDEARDHILKEMAAFRDKTLEGLHTIADFHKDLIQRADDMTETIEQIGFEATRVLPDVEQVTAAMRPQLATIARELDGLLHQSDDMPRLLKIIAEEIRDNGGPDWTDSPSEIPARLREALGAPDLVERLDAFTQSLVSSDDSNPASD